MKVKLFTFLGLLIATVIVSVAFGAAPVQAKGEKYKWVNRSTIEVSGGVYSELSFIADNNESWNKRFSGDGYNKRVSVIPFANATEIGCTVTLNLSISADNRHGTLKISEGGIKCHKDSPLFDLDKKFTLSNPSKGPAMGGSELEYKKGLNCTEAYAGGHPSQRGKNIERCEAVKECVVEKKKTEFQCLQAWALCMEENNENTGKCKDSVGAGNVDETEEEEDQKKNETTCAVDGIGWIICPVMTFLASIVDAAYEYVLSTLLEVQPLFTTGESKGVYDAWSVMRNFANVAFVIAFMVIIFSQVTSVGITNYGIKKMLPRLVISAILVNISYWICAAAVDISNIAGASIKDMFDAVGASLKPPEGLTAAQTGEGAAGGWGGIVAVVLAGGVALYVGLSALLPFLITVAFAIITVLLVLALRQALIILLIVISPLAFVAYLLPNTEDLFTKWRKLLGTLLLMYPIIGLIFGASALASMVITKTANDNIIVQIMGAGIAIIPLFITPIVMKTAGGVLGKFGAVVNNPNKGPFDRMRKRAEGFRDNRKDYRNLRAMEGKRVMPGVAGMYQRRAKREAKLSSRKSELTRSNASYVANEAESNPAFRRSLARGGGEGAEMRALASAVSVQAKIQAEEVTAASAVIKNLNLDRNRDAMQQLSMGGKAGGLDGSNYAVKAAAMKNVVDGHDVEGVNKLLDNVGSMDQKTRESFADSLASSSEKPQYVGQSALTAIRQHGNKDANGNVIQAKNSTELTVEAINNNTYSVEKLATGDKEELTYVAQVAADPNTGTNNTNFAANANTAINDPRFAGKLGKNADIVDTISRL